MVENRLPWKVKLGLTLFLSGLVISFFMLSFMEYYSREIGEEPEINFFTYLSIRIAGNVMAIIGFILLLLGFLEMNRVQKHLWPPPPSHGIDPLTTMVIPYVLCNRCQRKIPFDSNLCPYCGVDLIEESTVTLKNG